MWLFKNSPIAFLVGISCVIPIQAHNLEAQIKVKQIDFEVSAYYEDGTPARNATAEVITSDGTRMNLGKTDGEGRVDFSNSLKDKVEVVVEDETGHREVFPLSPAAIALAIKGEAAELEHTHAEEGDHDHAHEEEGDHDPAVTEAEHSHGVAQAEDIVLAKAEGGSQMQRVFSGFGYVLGITGILFYFLGLKQKAGA